MTSGSGTLGSGRHRFTGAIAGVGSRSGVRVVVGTWRTSPLGAFADVMLGHILYRYFDVDFARVPTRNLEAYYRRCTERPAYREHVMVSYDSLRVA